MSEDNEDPVLPAGYNPITWNAGDPIEHFMVWTAVNGQQPDWHHGHVCKVLKSHKRYTHDVFLDGTREKRGMALNASGYADGCWYPMAQDCRRPASAAASVSAGGESPEAIPRSSIDEHIEPESPAGVLEQLVQV